MSTDTIDIDATKAEADASAAATATTGVDDVTAAVEEEDTTATNADRGGQQKRNHNPAAAAAAVVAAEAEAEDKTATNADIDTTAAATTAVVAATAVVTEAKGKHQKPMGKQRMGTVTLAAAIAQAEAEEAAGATQKGATGDDDNNNNTAEENATEKAVAVMETTATATATVVTHRRPGWAMTPEERDSALAEATARGLPPGWKVELDKRKRRTWIAPNNRSCDSIPNALAISVELGMLPADTTLVPASQPKQKVGRPPKSKTDGTQKGTKKARTTIPTTMATHNNSTKTPFLITSIHTGKGATMHRKWNLHYTALQEYVQAHRGTYPKYPKAKGKKTIAQHGAVGSLYDWCNYQRSCYNTTPQHGTLTPHMIVALERLPNWFWIKKQPTTTTIYTNSSTTIAMRSNFPRTTPSKNEAPTAAVATKDRPHTASSQQQGFPYTEVVTHAILALNDRTGSHYTAIQKWIIANHPPNVIDPAKLTQKINLTLKKGVEKLRFLKIKMSYTVNPAWLKAQKKKEATQQKKTKAAFARGYPAWLKAQEKKKTALGKKEVALEKKEAALKKKKVAFEKKMVALARGSTTPGNKREPYKKAQAQKEKEATPGGKQGPYKKKVTATDTTRNSPQPGTPRKKRGPYKKKGTTTTDTTSTSTQPGRPSKDTTMQQLQQQRHHDDDVEERAWLKSLVELQASTIAAHAVTIRNLERRLVTLEEAAAARTDRCANATTTATTTNEGTGEQKDETEGGTRS